MSATEFEGMPDPRWKELYALRTQTRQQAERIRELERLVTSQGISSMEDLDENQQLRAALVDARDVANRCHRMLISEPDTQGVLFKAENILRELVCDASDILSDHTPLQPAGEEDKTIYNKMAANYNGQPVEDKEQPCNPHPDAPHGYDRTASHNLGRYVCECEGWKPEDPRDKVIEAVERFINSPISVETCTNMLAAIEQFRKEKV